MLVEPAKEWHFYRLIDGAQGRGYKKSRLNFAAWQTRDTHAAHIILPLPCRDEKRQNPAV
jgi:hypothetical protein